MKKLLPGVVLLLAYLSLPAHVAAQGLTISSASLLPSAVVNSPYSFQFVASGANGNSLTWDAPSGTPPGLTLDPSGFLSGTPSSAVTNFSFVVVVAYVNGEKSSPPKTFTFSATTTGNTGPQITSPNPITPAEQNLPYSFRFTASGGDGSYSWSVVSGSQPPSGLSLSPGGVLSGSTSVAPGVYQFGVQVLSSDQTASELVSLTVVPPVAIASTSPLLSADLGSSYSFSFQASGGQAAYSWFIGSGSPPGLYLSSNGVLSGVPTATGLFTFPITVFDALSGTSTQPFQITVNPALVILSTSPLPPGETSAPYSFQFTGTGGSGSYAWSVAAENVLPPGLTLSSTGMLSGRPTTQQSSSFGIALTDSAGGTFVKTFQLQIGAGPSITSTSPLPTGTVGSPYNFTFLSSGGSGSNTWSVVSGSLPGGLSLNASTGVLSGTPTSAGTSNFVMKVTDASGGSATASFALTVYNVLAIGSTSPLPSGELSRPYSFTFTGTGGSGSYTWSAPSGSTLPAGLTLSTGGILSGTPTIAGTSSLTIQIADGAGHTATKNLQLQIVATPVITTTSPLPAGTVNTAYTPLTFTESGGIGPFQWSSSSLPAGLSFSSAGVLSGIPATAGTTTFPVTLIDAAGGTASGTFSLTIFSQLNIASASPLATGAVGSSYSFSFQAAGGSGSYTWSVASGSLPAGLSLSGTSGALSGTPSAAGTSVFAIQVTDVGRDNIASKTFSLTINNSLGITSASPLTSGEVTRPYSFTFTGTGGSGSYTWTVPSGSVLPPGLSLSTGGALTGTPTTPGVTSFSIQIADSSGRAVTKAFQLQVVAAPTITTVSPLPGGTVNAIYGPLTFAESGGKSPFQWSSSQLPSGLSLSSSGVLSGTPASAGTTSFLVTVTDAAGAMASSNFSLGIVSQLTITSSSPLPAGTTGSSYSFTLQASGGSGSDTWSVASGSLPVGLSLSSSTGILSGTPSTAGTSTFAVSVHDSSGRTANGSFALTINSNLSITSASPLAGGEVSRPYAFTFAGSGGSGFFTWAVASGSALPPGLALSAGGVLSGTPTAGGTTVFTVKITDASGNTAMKSFQLQILAAPVITTKPPLTPGTLNSAYGPLTFTESGGTPSFNWSSSQLPAGLSLSSAGVLSGTPTSIGTSSFSVTLTDAVGATTSAIFSLSVFSQLTISSASPLPGGAVGSPYSFSFQAGGGSGSYTWSVISGALPAGLSLNAGGTLSGTPSATGTSTFMIRVTDVQRDSSTSKTFSLAINSSLLITSTSPLINGEVSRPYSFRFTGAGGSGSFTWSMASGSTLPAGLSLSPGGTLAGTPGITGTASFSIQINDGSGNTAAKTFQLQIVAGPSVTTASPLLPGTVNVAYTPLTFTESGGTPPFRWSSSQLPPGLSLSSGGVLSGIPTSAGLTSFAVTVTDSLNVAASGTFSLTVISQLAIISTSPLAAGSVGLAYSFTFQAAGGSGSYSWSISSGSLPTGLSLNSTSGTLSGTPSGAGNFALAIQVTDVQRENQTSKTFTLSIASNFAITSPATLPPAAVGRIYSQQLTASGGVGSVTWSVASGLPVGLMLASSGLISGTPSTPGTFSFNVQAADTATPPDTSIKALTIVVATAIAPLRITSPTSLTGKLGTTFSLMFTASGGTPPYTWSVVNGALPSGLALAGASGMLSGKVSGVGPFSFTIQVTDSAGTVASQPTQLQFTLPQAPPLQITGIPTNPPANSQPAFQITIPNSFSFDIQGVLTLSFSSPSGVDDPAIQFINGTRSLAFTIPAGSTSAVFATGESPVFLTGTIAGTITLTTTQYQALGLSLTPVPLPVQVVIPPTAPVITSVTAARDSGGFTVTVIGFSPTRDVTGGNFSFLGSNLDTPMLALDLTTLFQGWFGNTTSDQFGSQFKLTQPFNFHGGSGNVKFVSVTLTNSIGTSQLVTAPVE